MNREEAIKIVKSHYPANKQMLNEALEYLIPELKEKTDEEVRQQLIAIVNLYYGEGVDAERDKCLEWLEKQVTPQVRTGIEWVNTIDDACDKRYSEEYAHGEYCHEQSFKWGFQEGVDWLEKQGEQKPIERKEFTSIPFGAYDSELVEETIKIPDGYVATIEGNKIHIKREGKSAIEAIKEEKVDNTNKVEPTFKVGDWVVKKDGTKFSNGRKLAQITKIDGEKHWLNTGTYLKKVKNIRLWTLADAQAGDVLVCPKYAGDTIPNIFIFKDIDINNDVLCYCSFLKIFFATGGYIANADPINTDFYPATKEQYDLLFQKMKESGYEWNADKKELKNLIKHL